MHSSKIKEYIYHRINQTNWYITPLWSGNSTVSTVCTIVTKKINSVNLQYELDITLKIISQNNKRLYCHGRKVIIYHRTNQTNWYITPQYAHVTEQSVQFVQLWQ